MGAQVGRPHRRSGQSLIEFALAAPVLLLVIGLGVDLGRAFYFEITATQAARDAARVAIGQPLSQGQGPGMAAICLAAENDLTNVQSVSCGTSGTLPAKAGQAVVIVSCPDSSGNCTGSTSGPPVNGTVTVTVQYGFALVMPLVSQLVPGGLIQLHNSAQMVTSW